MVQNTKENGKMEKDKVMAMQTKLLFDMKENGKMEEDRVEEFTIGKIIIIDMRES